MCRALIRTKKAWFHMAARQEKEALQTVVISCFSAILSGDQQQRKDAEEELKALEVTEGQ